MSSARSIGQNDNSAFVREQLPDSDRKDALVRAHWMKGEDQLMERDLGFVRRGFRWALTTPMTRDVVSSSQTFFRWCAHRPDPHLMVPNGSEADEKAQPRAASATSS